MHLPPRTSREKRGELLGSEEKEYIELSQITENKAAQTLAHLCNRARLTPQEAVQLGKKLTIFWGTWLHVSTLGGASISCLPFKK